MQGINLKLLALSGFLFLLTACDTRPKIVQIPSQWSSLDPGSIPLNVRKKEFSKGNLVTNPSFELGRDYMVDSSGVGFNLTGWKRLGENVAWVNIQEGGKYKKNEVSAGNHAVRIDRRRADETDKQGEGIISDFIRVIPGNYQLSMDLRLEHIESNMKRLGTGLFDAVNIRLYFYDRNKVLIAGPVYHPLRDITIDNSFKGLPFANFDYIPEFGWSRILCRSANFPFREGFIPDETRYVKIFAGLKGTGKMWIDQVDFRYSAQNFSLLESSKSLADSTMDFRERLLPRPRSARYFRVMKTSPSENLQPVILIPPTADPAFKSTIQRFIARLKQEGVISKSHNPLTGTLSSARAAEGQLVFSFGSTSLAREFSGQIPSEEIEGHSQAYYIHSPSNPGNLIFIGFTDQEGLERALSTLLQALTSSPTEYLHHDISDYPDFTTRAVIIPTGPSMAALDLSFAEDLVKAGYNTLVLEPRDENLTTENFLVISEKPASKIRQLKDRYPFLKTGYSLREVKLTGFAENSGETEIIKEAGAMAVLLKKLKETDPDLILLSDQPMWQSLNQGTTASVSLHFSRSEFEKCLRIRELFWEEVSKHRVFEPGMVYLQAVYSDNRDNSRLSPARFQYYESIEKFREVYSNLLWTGPSNPSSLIDMSDFQQYSANLGLPVVLLDNSLTRHVDDLNLLSSAREAIRYPASGMLDLYRVNMSNQLAGNLGYACFINLRNADEASMTGLYMAADRLWNGEGFIFGNSFWNSLRNRYGRETALLLLSLNDKYCRLLNISAGGESQGNRAQLIREGESLITSIDRDWQKITLQFAADPDFLNTLADRKNLAISRFYMLRRRTPAVQGNEDGTIRQ